MILLGMTRDRRSKIGYDQSANFSNKPKVSYICTNLAISVYKIILQSLRWRHNGCYSVSNHQPHHCLLNRLFRRRSKKTSKLRVTGLCAKNSPGTGEFSAQMASNAENVSIWWRHHVALALLMTWAVTCPFPKHNTFYGQIMNHWL